MSNSKANSQKGRDVTVSYIWRVHLQHLTRHDCIELLVMCNENIMGDRFQRACEDAFRVGLTKGTIPVDTPSSLSEYSVLSVNNLGLAAGSVGTESFNGVSIGRTDAGHELVLNAEKACALAGLIDDSVVAKESIKEAKRKLQEDARKVREETLKRDIHNPALTEVLLDTAVRMANGGDEQPVVPEVAIKEALEAGAELTNKRLTFGDPPVVIIDE